MESLSAQVPFDWWIADENRPMHRQSSWLQYFVVPWKVEDRALGTAYVMQSYNSCCGLSLWEGSVMSCRSDTSAGCSTPAVQKPPCYHSLALCCVLAYN